MRGKFYIILLMIVLLLVSADLFSQCSQCKLLAEQSGSTDDEILGSGNNINTAILYIMTIPYIILVFLFRKQLKRFFKNKLNLNSN